MKKAKTAIRKSMIQAAGLELLNTNFLLVMQNLIFLLYCNIQHSESA